MQATPAEERTLWLGSPSQWLNFKAFLLDALAILVLEAVITVLWVNELPLLRGRGPAVLAVAILLALIPLLGAVRAYLNVRFKRYTLTTERVRVATGIFTRRTDELELYRVDDTLLMEPFLLRLVSRGNIVLITSDPTNPHLIIEAVPGAAALRDQLRHYREICRDRKRTQVVDFVSEGHP